jgi:hypothetical protein
MTKNQYFENMFIRIDDAILCNIMQIFETSNILKHLNVKICSYYVSNNIILFILSQITLL